MTDLLSSPTWLVRVGRFTEAEAALRKLAVKAIDVRPTLMQITEVDRLEVELDKSTSYRECFVGTNRRRTVISIMTYTSVINTGTFVVGWSAYILSRMCKALLLP